jgi:PST family polysaccharide transporter
MRRYLVPLFVANIVAFGSVALSYLIYSRLLAAQQFGAYAAALAVGTLAVLVLDGGIKTSIIKHATALTRQEEGSLMSLMLAFSWLLLFILYFGQSAIGHFYPAAIDQTKFVSAFAAVYLLTYPWIGLSTASLERNLAYPQLAWIESIGTVLERGSPAILLASTTLGLGSFVLGLAIGRVTRIILLSRVHSVALGWPLKDNVSVRRLLKEGFLFQVGGAASLIRDNLHLIIVGPLFGALWVGYYAWGLQLCAIASQVFVQISARVSLSVTAKAANFSKRWSTIAQQISLLTAATAPILVAMMLIAPTLDHYFFADKWHRALTLLPLLFARMIPGIACTPIGALLLVERGANIYARALWLWTMIELAAAYLAVKMLGPTGLAVSYSATAWIGVFFLLSGFGIDSFSLLLQVCSIIFRRPALWVSVGVAAACLSWIYLSGQPLGLGLVTCGLLCVVGAYLVDSSFRAALVGRKF